MTFSAKLTIFLLWAAAMGMMTPELNSSLLNAHKITQRIPIHKLCTRLRQFIEDPNRKVTEQFWTYMRNGVAQKDKGDFIGKGGFGAVYGVTYDTQPAVVKIIARSERNDAEAGKEIFNWLTIMAANSADVVEAHDCMYDEWYIYIVQGKMRDNLLKFVIENVVSADKYGLHVKMAIAEQMIDQLNHMHALKLVHHDIKLENFLYDVWPNQEDMGFNDENPNIVVKIADFGLTRSNSVKKLIAGTKYTMAPEVWAERETLEPSDIYSLGIAFWNLFTNDVDTSATCYTYGGFTMQCCVNLQKKMASFFEGKFGYVNVAKVASIKTAKNIAEVIYLMLTFAADRRPTAAQIHERILELFDPIYQTFKADYDLRHPPKQVEGGSGEKAKKINNILL